MTLERFRQTRIFVPVISPFDSDQWYEQVLGEIILPLFQSHENNVHWLWFTRYSCPLGTDDGDCDISKVPASYIVNNSHRSVRLRLSPKSGLRNKIELDGSRLIQQAGCYITDWRDYNLIDDLGGNRFSRQGSNCRQRMERAEYIAEYLHYLSLLILSSLVSPDVNGKWHFESKSHPENPHDSFLESVHHLFCNMTSVRLDAHVYRQNDEMRISTFWNQLPSPPWQPIVKVPLHF